MKKNSTIHCIRGVALVVAAVFVWCTPMQIFAATASPTATLKTTPSLEQTAGDRAQIEELKERLATKVAELRTLVKRAMHGTVTTVSITSATVETSTKNIKIELGDEVKVTQVISGKRTVLSTDAIEVDDPITVFGTYDATLDLLQAQYIFIERRVEPKRVLGTITNIDEDNNMITVKTPQDRHIDVDIEKTTKTSSWSKSGGIVKSGFSKLAIGDSIHMVGTPDPKNENQITAIRILNVGNITGEKPTPTLEATPTPKTTDAAAP